MTNWFLPHRLTNHSDPFLTVRHTPPVLANPTNRTTPPLTVSDVPLHVVPSRLTWPVLAIRLSRPPHDEPLRTGTDTPHPSWPHHTDRPRLTTPRLPDKPHLPNPSLSDVPRPTRPCHGTTREGTFEPLCHHQLPRLPLRTTGARGHGRGVRSCTLSEQESKSRK